MKRLIQTNRSIYDKTGKFIGKEVIEVDGFTEAELKNDPACAECGAYNGGHREYWITTSMDHGEVRGHFQKCSHMRKK